MLEWSKLFLVESLRLWAKAVCLCSAIVSVVLEIETDVFWISFSSICVAASVIFHRAVSEMKLDDIFALLVRECLQMGGLGICYGNGCVREVAVLSCNFFEPFRSSICLNNLSSDKLLGEDWPWSFFDGLGLMCCASVDSTFDLSCSWKGANCVGSALLCQLLGKLAWDDLID